MGEDAVAQAQTITVVSHRSRSDRAQADPNSGSSQYHFSDTDIANLPQGNATPLNQVLLQAPGIVQDGFGQVHVRGDHGNLQYRVNGVLIPEAVTGFGQFLDTRFADQLSVITGALPAQYGYRTAGIVDIHTRPPGADPGGELSLAGGSRNYGEAGGLVNGANGRFSYDLTGSWMTSQQGIDNPTSAINSLHDQTRQGKGFGVLSYDLTPQQRVSLTFGQSNNQFQIPDNPGLTPQCCASTLQGTPAPQNLNANQLERNQFEVVSLQSRHTDQMDYQVSLYHRLSESIYTPDPNLGDLFYGGVSNNVTRRDEAEGIQTDVGIRWRDNHTFRTTLMVQRERFLTNNQSQVYCLGVSLYCSGNQLDAAGVASTPPVGITNNTAGMGQFWGVSGQDEWAITPALTVNYGLRFDQNNTITSENQLSPRFGLVYDINPATHWHAGYAKYFTPPSPELIDTRTVASFANTTNASLVQANGPIRAERSDYLDTGLSHQVSEHLTLDVDSYYRKVQHLLDEGQFGNALIFSSFNYQQGRIYGLEFSGNWHDERWNAALNAALGRAQGKGIESGQFNFSPAELAYISNHWVYLDHDQRYTFSGSLGYRGDWAKWNLDTLIGSGLRAGFANTQTMSDYAVFNGAATHLFHTQSFGELEGRVSILNLLDHSYELRNGTGIGVGAPQYGLRRTLILGVTRFF